MNPIGKTIICPVCDTLWQEEPAFFYAVSFKADPGYNHLVWICPSENCYAGMILFVSSEVLDELQDMGMRLIEKPLADANMRTHLRLIRHGTDNPSYPAPLDEASVLNWLTQLNTVSTTDDILQLLQDAEVKVSDGGPEK